MNPSCKAIMMVGIQGAGKSYFTEEFAKKFNYTHLCNDELPNFKEALNVTIAKQRNLIIDKMNLQISSRIELTTLLKANNYEVQCYYIPCLPSRAIENLDKREKEDLEKVTKSKERKKIKEKYLNIKRLITKEVGELEPPTLGEEFSQVHYISNNKIVYSIS